MEQTTVSSADFHANHSMALPEKTFEEFYSSKNTEYKAGDCPVAEEILDTCIKLQVNEFFTEQDLEDTIKAFEKVCTYFHANK